MSHESWIRRLGDFGKLNERVIDPVKTMNLRQFLSSGIITKHRPSLILYLNLIKIFIFERAAIAECSFECLGHTVGH